MLKSLFQWLDRNPGSYWVLAGAATILLAMWVGRTLRREYRGPVAPGWVPGWGDGVVLFLFLLAWRWPFLLVAYEYNPDESQMIAGAMTLARDPVFWRSVDGGSSGPLNYYLMVPWHWFGVPLDYFTARLTCLLLTWGTLFVSLRTLARAYGCTAGWLGLLPAAGFFATLTHPELTNLSTENLPLLLIAMAFGLLAGRAPADRFRLWAACFLAGAMPWAKLQSAPIGLALIGWAGWQVMRDSRVTAPLRWRLLAELLLAAALPTLLAAGLAAATGQLETAWRRYILQNILYVGTSEVVSYGEALRAMWRNAQEDGRFPLLLGTTVAGVLATVGFFAVRRWRLPGLLGAAVVVTLATAAAIVAPRREFLHYVLLLPVPLLFCFGAALGGWWKRLDTARSRLLLAGFGLAAGLLPVLSRALQPTPSVFGGFVHHWKYPRSSAANLLHALTGPGDTVGVWGWACLLHVESGLPQATRDGTTLWSIQDNPQQAYHRANYLADLRRSAPAVFVDAVGQGACVYTDRGRQAHEIFPELADYIRQNYTLVVDLIDARIYARNGLATHRDLSSTRLWQLIGQGRPREGPVLSPPSSTLNLLQRRVIDGSHVVMLLPPAQVEWQLDDQVREVSLEFGYDPAAYDPGKSNGTELMIEIVSPDSSYPLYQRFLDPARQPGDRGRQSVRVTLPPFPPGSKLVLRTDPGQYGDTAWDWVYLASLKLHREPGAP